jgi:nitrate reductase gamma subunit
MEVIYPKPWVLFWLFVICGHLYLDYSFYRRWKGWSRGVITGFSLRNLKVPVLKIWLYEVFMQRQLFSLSVMRWLIHQCIFWGFICLTLLSLSKFILLLLSMISLDAGLHSYFSSGPGYPFTKLWGDFFGLILFAGCVGALARRFVFRPIQTAHDQTDTFLSAYLLFMTFSGFMLEGLRMAAFPADLDRYAFIGRLFMPSQFGIVSDTGMWLAWAWIVHAFSGAAILIYLPHSKLLHSLLAPLVIALNASEEQGRKDMYWPKTKQYRPTK